MTGPTGEGGSSAHQARKRSTVEAAPAKRRLRPNKLDNSRVLLKRRWVSVWADVALPATVKLDR